LGYADGNFTWGMGQAAKSQKSMAVLPSGIRLRNYGKSMKIIIFHGKNHYFDWAMFNSKL
jgi:hypothetical protein